MATPQTKEIEIKISICNCGSYGGRDIYAQVERTNTTSFDPENIMHDVALMTDVAVKQLQVLYELRREADAAAAKLAEAQEEAKESS